jgi:dCMP deaminase
VKPKLIKAYMETAKIFADLSHAQRLHVGAIVVKDDRIISIGYNGMPSGWDNECEYVAYQPSTGFEDAESLFENGWIFGVDKDDAMWTKKITKPEVLHAESNAIAKLARSNESGEGSTIFITHSPCIECAKLIYQSGISRVFYGEDYRDDTGIKFLLRSGVEVEKVNS